MLPTKFATQQFIVTGPPGAGRLLNAVANGLPRAFLVVNRGTYRARIGADVGVAAESVGFLLRPGEGLMLVTAAEVWGSNSTYHIVNISQ